MAHRKSNVLSSPLPSGNTNLSAVCFEMLEATMAELAPRGSFVFSSKIVDFLLLFRSIRARVGGSACWPPNTNSLSAAVDDTLVQSEAPTG